MTLGMIGVCIQPLGAFEAPLGRLVPFLKTLFSQQGPQGDDGTDTPSQGQGDFGRLLGGFLVFDGLFGGLFFA